MKYLLMKTLRILFVDTFVTVNLDDQDVKGIVNEVNTHHHTKACRKKVQPADLITQGYLLLKLS